MDGCDDRACAGGKACFGGGANIEDEGTVIFGDREACALGARLGTCAAE